jgi:hypothetical protein
MRLYICRWENGDFSVVPAKSKEHAIEMLDEKAKTVKSTPSFFATP